MARLRPVASILAALALALIAPARADAADATRTKQVYFAADASTPDLAKDYLNAHPGNALEISTFTLPGQPPAESYYAFGPVARSRAGVCRFTETQIFPVRAEDGSVLWSSIPTDPAIHADPPAMMAAVAPAACPKPSENDYSALDDGIADADFLSVAAFWKEIAASAMKFDDAAGLLPLIISTQAAAQFDRFRASVFAAQGAPVQMRAVFKAGVNAYDLSFSDASDSPAYFLSISKSGTGFQMLNFQSQY